MALTAFTLQDVLKEIAIIFVGNIRKKKRVEYVKHILDECGIGGERVAMYNMSSAEGQRFAEIAREMTEKVRKFRPNPAKKTAVRNVPVAGRNDCDQQRSIET